MLGSKLKILGLCTLALAVMAISAGSAQAEKGAFWLVSGVKISEALLPSLGGSLVNNTGKLLAKIGANSFHITCTAATTVGAHLVEPNGSLLGQVKFSGCKLFKLVGETATLLGACEPHVGAEKGVIITNEGKGLILLHEFSAGVKEGVVDLEPKVGNVFATIVSSEECAFGEKIVVGGFKNAKGEEVVTKLVVSNVEKLEIEKEKFIEENNFLKDQVTHVIKELPALTKLYINKNEANVASIDGSANIFLTGAHEGLTWAGHPA
jgi:hypothetical protein